ncbi:MAG: DUF115 domain-containing protein [Phycisphaerales bacterium]|nr:MAG: DUF115 domain-containing protein [Phycisphaerales bacterium]
MPNSLASDTPATAPAPARTPGAPSDAVLDANLRALARLSPDAAEAIRRAGPCADAEFFPTDDGALGARLGGRLLASARRPREEAQRFCEGVDVRDAAGIVVAGFGLGLHVEELARSAGRTVLLIVYEPDVELLRAVLERVDMSAALHGSNVLLLTDPDDAAAISAGLTGMEAFIAMGVEIVEHPPSVPRLGDSAARFGRTLARVVAAVRTNVVTTMMQTETTTRNTLMNVAWYAGREGVEPLRGACAGLPAVVVSAGPSLERNMRLLAAPGVRERCVIVAVQTALKPLLNAGVRPHFVTALDYHEISARFYEGLTPADVAGVTLIAEPKANPAILDAFPGAVRCPRDEFLDAALGDDLAGEHGAVPSGATVAHLSYYFARWLGCDPVALIGQDLGFTDGQYYAGGAAIHDVWAPELNMFRTLEMMEWERIVRSRAILRRAEDHLGRPVYTDEQMATYLAQFERDFRADAARGLRIVDATEGGVRKTHAETATLADFLRRHAHDDAPRLPDLDPPAAYAEPSRRADVRDRLRDVRQGVWRIGECARKADRLLEEMLTHHDDQPRVNRLIGAVDRVRDEAVATQPAYELVHRFNQAGSFNRARADRAIALERDLPPLERQRRQIERDAQNVRWMGDAADALGALLDEALRVYDGAVKPTRDSAPRRTPAPTLAGERAPTKAKQPTRVDAVVHVPGDSRALRETFAGRMRLLSTLDRLTRCARIDRVFLLTDDVEGVREAVSGAGARVFHVEQADGAALRMRTDRAHALRRFAPDSWRGAPGGLTVFDEALAPEALLPLMQREGMNAALLVGADWALVDPALCDAVIDRHLEHPERHPLAFTQAAPGLCGVVIDRRIVEEMARAGDKAGAFGTLGGLLSYLPVRPKADPIAQPVCVRIDAEVRDAGVRCIPDTRSGARAMEAALGGADAATIDALSLVRTLRAHRGNGEAAPRELFVELCDTPTTARRRIGAGARQDGAGATASLASFARLLEAYASVRDDLVVSFEGRGDTLAHPAWADFVACARERGSGAIHVRTDLRCAPESVDALLAAAPDTVSVDLLAETPETYHALTGFDDFARVQANVERLLELRPGAGWMPGPWLGVRITRCDATYTEVETFYDRWLLRTGGVGGAIIDPLLRPIEGERIAPLPAPRLLRERVAGERMFLRCDGAAALDEHFEHAVAHDAAADPAGAWRAVREARAGGGGA